MVGHPKGITVSEPMKIKIEIPRKEFENYESVIDRNLLKNSPKAVEKTLEWKNDNHFRQAKANEPKCKTCAAFNFIKCQKLYDLGLFAETELENTCDQHTRKLSLEAIIESQVIKYYSQIGPGVECCVFLTLDERNGGYKLVCAHFQGENFQCKAFNLMIDHLEDHARMKHKIEQKTFLELTDDRWKFKNDANQWKAEKGK